MFGHRFGGVSFVARYQVEGARLDPLGPVAAPGSSCGGSGKLRAVAGAVLLELGVRELSSEMNTHSPCVRRKRGRLPSNVSIRSVPAAAIPLRPGKLPPGHSG
jgi:hypothetical protein